MLPISPIQGLIDWLSGRWDALLDALDVVSIVVRLSLWMASYLATPDPRVADVAQGAVDAVNTVVPFIGLADYFINLPIFLLVVGIIITAETGLTFFRMWRTVRSVIT